MSGNLVLVGGPRDGKIVAWFPADGPAPKRVRVDTFVVPLDPSALDPDPDPDLASGPVIIDRASDVGLTIYHLKTRADENGDSVYTWSGEYLTTTEPE